MSDRAPTAADTAPADITPGVPRPVLARALDRTGLVAAGALVVGAAREGARTTADGALVWALAFAASGLAFVWIASRLLTAVYLRAPLRAELTRGNLAAALLSAGHHLAAGLVAAHVLYGHDLSTWLLSAAFFWVGVATLLLFVLLHRTLTHYADDQEIRGDNLAAALAAAGLVTALGLIVGHALEGTFQGWGASLLAYGRALLLALGLYPVRQLVVSRLLLGFPLRARAAKLDQLVSQERATAVAGLEAAAYLATALFLVGVA